MRTQSSPPLPLIEERLVIGGRTQGLARSTINRLKILCFRELMEPPVEECLLRSRFVWREKDLWALFARLLRLADSHVLFQHCDLLGSPCGLLHQKATEKSHVSIRK